MKFLAFDTAGKRLAVVAVNGEKKALFEDECEMRHSEFLFPAIGQALEEAELALPDCDFIACVVGPGSFTGIRIGISAAKGLCFGAGLPALGVTSFDVLAYAEKSEKKIAAVDAGHGYLYAEGFGVPLVCGYYPAEEIFSLAERERALLLGRTDENLPARKTGGAEGLLAAVRALADGAGSADGLAALYLRKASAEEGR